MQNIRVLAALATLLCASPALSQDGTFPLSMRVTNEVGQPLPGAVVVVGGHKLSVDSDGFVRTLSRGRNPLTLNITAPGYYSSVHTLRPGISNVPDVQLVEKKTGRRLLLFAGDAMLSRRFMRPRAGERVLIRADHIGEDGRRMLRFIKPYVGAADFASVNLESVLSADELSNPLPKSVTFYSPTELAGLLQWAGFDYVALGNNHSYDFRDAGIKSTLAALDETDIGYSGAGLTESAARAPHRSKVSGAAVALLSYVGWPGTFTPTQSASGNKGGAALGNAAVFAQDISAVAGKDIVVVQQHAGIEYAETPAMTERSDLRSAVDAGADVVIGHHPHVLQGIEVHNRRLIAYSMGNFLFDQYIYSTQGGMLLYVWLDGEVLHRADIVPLNINGYVPTPATGAFRYWVLNRIARLSAGFGSCFEQSGQHAVIRPDTACSTAIIEVADKELTGNPIALRERNISPVQPLSIAGAERQYRIGVDLLPRGDFEATGLFGSPPRAWLSGDHAKVSESSTSSGQQLSLVVPPGERVRTGMKVFDRAFQTSAPATASGRVLSDQPAKLTVYLQRRRTEDGLDDALRGGPLTRLGQVSLRGGDWQTFSVDHAMPRTATKSVRLLIDIEPAGDTMADVNVEIDDLAWIEWRTPWLHSGAAGSFGTHVQFKK